VCTWHNADARTGNRSPIIWKRKWWGVLLAVQNCPAPQLLYSTVGGTLMGMCVHHRAMLGSANTSLQLFQTTAGEEHCVEGRSTIQTFLAPDVLSCYCCHADVCWCCLSVEDTGPFVLDAAEHTMTWVTISLARRSVSQ
jgi:hypothetical protein